MRQKHSAMGSNTALRYTAITLAENMFLLCSTAIGVTWVLWYFIKFTIVPWLNPSEPRELPYCIPWLGSAIGFQKNSDNVMKNGRKYSKNRQPFALVLGGKKFYILTNPKDVSECYKNMKTLSFDLFVRELMLNCGSSKSCVEKMCQEPPQYIHGAAVSSLNPGAKSIARLAVDFHHRQLHPGESSKLNDLGDKLTTYIDKIVTWENVRSEPHYTIRNLSSGVEVSLYKFCGKVLIEAATSSYFGDSFLDIDPNLLDCFYEFDDGMWQLLYNYPEFMCKDLHVAKRRLVAVLATYFERPHSERSGEAWFTEALEEEQRLIGLTEEEMASTILIIYFALNANTFKWAFWVFSHLLFDPNLMISIREELLETMPDGKLNVKALIDGCPKFNSLLDEVLRLYSNSSSVRYILEDTIIAGKLFRKGNRIMMPYRQLHENEDVYGHNVLDFDPERFMKDKTLRRGPSFRPFGGGSTYCPGRFAARQEVATYIALVLYRFDVQVVANHDGSTQPVPRLESAKPSFGMMGTVNGDDLKVIISRRKS